MAIVSKREAALLLLGDLFFLYIALWVTLLLRYLELPSAALLYNHFVPFSLLFIAWILVFFIAGLYDRHTTFLQKKLPQIIFQAQAFNIVLAALFFFIIPYFGITPKTNLVIYLIASFIIMSLWRLWLFPLLGVRRKTRAILIGSGKEMQELADEVNKNPRYKLSFVLVLDTAKVSNPNDIQKVILERVGVGDVSVIVANTSHEHLEPLLPLLYNMAFFNAHFSFVDLNELYENIFNRIPLSLISHEWFLKNISGEAHPLYETAKRGMDILSSILLGIPSLLMLPFVWLAIKIEDGGPIFIVQDRVGKGNHLVRIYKFRSMTGNDAGSYGESGKTRLEVTKVGAWMRMLRIDELPQLWNVIRGDLSLIGPRLELPPLVEQYAKQIPYYPARHLIKPGLTGWAQLYHDAHPHHGADIAETKTKLSYDLYYLKNRSILLDLSIWLKTIKVVLSKSGV